MYATKFSIINYRRFESFETSFHRHFTLLMGANGSGKTSLLRAIHGALTSFGQCAGVHLAALIQESDVRRTNSVDPGDQLWRTPTYPCRGVLWTKLADETELFAFEKQSNGYEIFPTGDLRETSIRSYNVTKAAAATWFDPSKSVAIPIIARYSATNAQGTGTPGVVQPPFNTKQEVWQRFIVEVVDATWLAQWFQYNELRTLQERKAPLVYRRVKEAVLSAIHAQDVKYVVRDNQLMLLHADQGWRPFNDLSDGQRRIAAIFCDLALRCASLNSQLGEDCIAGTSGIVTIDELDLHLHPSWQRNIVADLRRVFPNIQFIVTSHSPFLLQAAFDHGAVVDMRTGQFVAPSDNSIEDIAEDVMGVPQPQRSQRFIERQKLATRYLELLESTTSDPDEVAKLKRELDAAMAVFADDPASAAWLAQRREVAGV